MPGEHDGDCDSQRESEDPEESVGYPRGVVGPGGGEIERGEEERVAKEGEEGAGKN